MQQPTPIPAPASAPDGLTSAQRMVVLSVLHAARAAARIAGCAAPADPVDRWEWAASGAVFERAGIEGFLDDVTLPASSRWRGAASIGSLRELIARLDSGREIRLGDLYARAIPAKTRHALGEHYTPPWLVEHVLDRVGFDGRRDRTIADPMCGAGAFTAAALRRLRRARSGMPAEDAAALVTGLDLNPVAVLMARAACLEALEGAPRRGTLRLNISLADALDPACRAVEHDRIAGNPPWVGWETLTPAQRDATRSSWHHHGLFTRSVGRGMQAILGGGKKDLAMLATMTAAERFLAPGGTLAFVITQTVFKSAGSGAGFRRFMLADGTPLGVTSVDDFSQRRVFAGAGARPAVLTLRKGESTRYPVPWLVWPRGPGPAQEQAAEPVDPRDATSAWLNGTPDRIASMRGILGPSALRARAGAYTGGANGVFWMEVIERGADGAWEVANLASAGKRSVAPVRARIEEALLYPLLRASDVHAFRAEPSAWILMTQDPLMRRGIESGLMASRYPRALRYLERFREPLAARRDRGTRSLVDAGAPFYSIFSVSEETMAPWKVVWRRIDSRVRAAILGPCEGRPVIPQETCTFIACRGERPDEEAAFLTGILNSTRLNEAAAAFAPIAGKSFGAPHLLRHIAVPRYDPVRPAHRALARLVKEHSGSVAPANLDDAVAEAWT